MKFKKISFEQIILLLFSVAFVLVDWRLGIMTFSDLLLMATFIFLLIFYAMNRNLYYGKNQLFIMVLLFILVLSNILHNLLFNINFNPFEGIQGFIKITFYLFVVFYVFNFIRERKLEHYFLNIIAGTAVTISILGIYISLALYSNGILPYEFFWEFTRQDLASYTYRGWDRSIIRTRSIFSEPAYLGFYLNAILSILYFNKSNFTIKKTHDFIITITILLTFSYSSILIVLGIKFLYYFGYHNIIAFFKRKRSLLFVVMTVILIGVFWDEIEKTILIRTREIISGADGSGTARLQGSWSHVNWDHLFMGNGIGNTQDLWNVYAYILSDLGVVSFILFVLFNIWLVFKNPKMAFAFIALNFQKGAYLGAGYWILITLVILYSIQDRDYEQKNLLEKKSSKVCTTRR